VNRIIFIAFFTTLQIHLAAQGLPVWYKNHNIETRNVNFKKYIKNNSTFSLVKIVDTISIPEVVSILVIDKEGKFSQELSLDTAAYCNSRELLIAGKKRYGKNLIGVTNLKGDVVIPMEYTAIRFNKDLFALKNQEYFWALFDSKGNKLSDFIYTDMSFTPFGKIKVRDRKGTGILNEDGTLLIENSYGEISQTAIDSFEVKEQDKWEYLDRQKKVKFTWMADSLIAVNDSILLYYNEGRVFIKDTLGKIIGSEKGYHKAVKFNAHLIKVSQGEYSGLVDLTGKEILAVKYYAIQQEKNGNLKVQGDEVKVLRYGDVINRSKKRWSLYDSLGRKILSKQYKTIRTYKEGMLAIQNDENLWGFANEKAVVAIEIKYNYVSDFKNGYALVRLPQTGENDYKLIDKQEQIYYTGKEAQLFFLGVIRYRTCEDTARKEGEPEMELYYGVPPSRYDNYTLAEYGYIRVKNGKYKGVLSPEGKEAVQAYQDTVYHASADTFFLYKRNNGLVGYSDRYCNTAMYLTDKFEDVQPLQEGYSKFKKEGLYGFIDMYGNVHIAPKYTACTEFHDGMAAVMLKGKWAFIDKRENIAVQPYYKEVKPFRNGFAPVKNTTNKWIFLNKMGKPVNSTLYDNFWKTRNEKYIVIKNKRWGITHPNGKEILSPKYEYLEEINDSLIKVKKDKKYGVMDYQENIILYYQYDDVKYNPFTDSFFVKKNGVSRKIFATQSKK
jgi:hypothetical protein